MLNFNKVNKSTLYQLREIFISERSLSFPKKYFIKKFDTRNYIDKDYLGYYCHKSDKIISHCGVIPLKYTFEKKDIIIGQTCDSITIHEFRGKGLYSTLIDRIEKNARIEGLDGLVVYANEKSAPIMQKMSGWQFIGSFNCYTIKVNSFPLNKIFNKLKIHNLYFTLLKTYCILNFTDKTQQNSNSKLGYSCIYDEHYISYKKYNKNLRISINGKYVWFSLSDGLFVGDFEKIDDINFESFLKKLVRFCKCIGIHQIKFVAFPNSFNDVLLKKYIGEVCSLNPVLVKMFSDIPVDRLYFNFAESNTF